MFVGSLLPFNSSLRLLQQLCSLLPSFITLCRSSLAGALGILRPALIADELQPLLSPLHLRSPHLRSQHLRSLHQRSLLLSER